jgi:hypothetical protein
VEGLILREGAGWNIVVAGVKNAGFNNVKVVGHYVSDDGMDVVGSVNTVVANSFIHNADDRYAVGASSAPLYDTIALATHSYPHYCNTTATHSFIAKANPGMPCSGFIVVNSVVWNTVGSAFGANDEISGVASGGLFKNNDVIWSSGTTSNFGGVLSVITKEAGGTIEVSGWVAG